MHLVLLETSGNQGYIFATNRLRQNVGASELTCRAGTRYVLEAVAASMGTPCLWDADPVRMRWNLLAQPHGAAAGRVIVATSGKALLLVETMEQGRRVVERATRAALVEAPGLDLCGVVSEAFDHDIAKQVRAVHRRFEQVHASVRGPAMRFAALPIVQPCASSGRPARRLVRIGNRDEPMSHESLAKSEAAPGWNARVGQLLGGAYRLPTDPDKLEKQLGDLDWVAVVHADGNGLGKLFLNFEHYLPAGGGDDEYVRCLREFSIELEEATERAFLDALRAVPGRRMAGSEVELKPVVPLVLGGDDMTVFCDGRSALPFTRRYLGAFERETDAQPAVRAVLAKTNDLTAGLGACAGVAVVKPHFPFHSAYDLSERLVRSAKAVKAAARLGPSYSAMDFHILYDSTYTDLDTIRGRLEADGGATRLTSKPYLAGHRPGAKDDPRHVRQLIDRVAAMTARGGRDGQDGGNGRATLSGGKLHELRGELYAGRDSADAMFRLMKGRQQGLDRLGEGQDSLFRDGPAWAPAAGAGAAGPAARETGFLDALESAPFWGQAPSRGQGGGQGPAEDPDGESAAARADGPEAASAKGGR